MSILITKRSHGTVLGIIALIGAMEVVGAVALSIGSGRRDGSINRMLQDVVAAYGRHATSG